ncbi:hypothetical protein Rin_00014600 [Candidatus Regiella insecticola 5.15]|uniref:Uncharacterized protein n=1 Tax=Candidatus Regiella insecticola 5.15 TaxID=1005043 RepID=G2H080_9ENTR|nr:hypothetical protein Rin_00014600 [Candidatus Regiella insecticola 5.15]
MVDAVNYSIPVNRSMLANFSRSLQDVTDVKNTNDTPTWVIPTIVVVGGALVVSLVYCCCKIMHRRD